MKRGLTLICTALFLTGPALAQGSKSKVVWPDCYCTDGAGNRIEMGETVCLSVGGREYLARCEMSLNNPMWREVRGDCITS